ncbi:hypothetical protein ABPG72_005953 [Tetrahymena utriculariae]
MRIVSQLNQKLVQKQDIRTKLILIMLLISKIVCLHSLGTQNQMFESTCDKNITEQLENQNIQYEQELEKSPQVEFSKNVIDLKNCQVFYISNIIANYSRLSGYLINAFNIQNIYFTHISVNNINFNQESIFNLVSIQNAQFTNLKFSKIQPKLFQKSQIINGSSTTFGGCINLTSSFYKQSQLVVSSSKFINCKSKYLGGAIAGIKQIEINNTSFEQCSSQIGGALFMIQQKQILFYQSFFIQNKGYLAANNYNLENINLEIDQIYEIVKANDNSQLIKIDKFLYPGLTYLIKVIINAEDEWYNTFNNTEYFGNIYDLLINPSNNFLSLTPPQLLNINFPFLLWYAFDIPFNDKQIIDFEPIQINFALEYHLQTRNYKIFNGCKKQGMEQIYLDNQKNLQYICKYCDQMKASYDGVCENCLTDYFSSCYGNYSMLKPSYWRSNYTVDPSGIYFCSNNPRSCKGGSNIGNDLCFEGHVGAQCLGCDLNGNYWQEKVYNFEFDNYNYINIQKTLE